MKSRFFVFGVFALGIVFISSGYMQQSAEQLYQSGLYKEKVEGELEKAIEIYDRIIKDFPENESIAAKALYHIGMCYEKLGKKEAQKAYQRLIDEYPGQKQEVAMAKERLASLTEAKEKIPHKPTFRKIQIPTKPGNGVLSPDGEKFAFASEGSIWVVPVPGKVSPNIAGEPIKLPGAERARDFGLSWSADGKWIAYNVEDNKKDAIYVIPSSGGEPKKVPVELDRRGHLYAYSLSLSPDGKVLAYVSRGETEQIKSKRFEVLKNLNHHCIYTAHVETGGAERLTDVGTWQPAFSPDGEKIAYVNINPLEDGKVSSDGWVIPSVGGTPVQVTDLAGRVRGPVWSPDGRMIAFNREPRENNLSREVWIVPVSEDGNPEAAPVKIELSLNTYDLIAGWTPDNKIGVHLVNPEHTAIYTVSVSGGKSNQVTPSGWPFHPRWSPDGKRIYFRWDKGNIASVPAGGGEVNVAPFRSDTQIFEVLPGGGNAVSPDGKKIVFSGAKVIDKDNKRSFEVNIFTIPIEGGMPLEITTSPTQDRFPCWSPDGKSIGFVRGHWKSKEVFINNIFIIPADGGESRQLTSESDKVAGSTIDWSPYGKSMAYFSKDKTIKVIPIEGGESREVVKVESISRHNELSWSPDGKKIAYASKGSIWVVSKDGREQSEVKTGLDSMADKIDWSPDGKKIAFTASKGGDVELWLMEDFLPLIKNKK